MEKHNVRRFDTKDLKIAYGHSMTFPNNEANAFDAVWTASALVDKVDTTFIVKAIKGSKRELKAYYYIPGSQLQFQSLYLDLLPDRLLGKIQNYYQKALSLYLRFHPAWRFSKYQKVLYLRDPASLRYFGLLREKQSWLQDWILIYESHDVLGMDPNLIDGKNPFTNDSIANENYRDEILRAAENFNAIICNTQALAVDLRQWTNNSINPVVISLASPLPRLDHEPHVTFGDHVILGYIGTVDKLRGVDMLIESLRYLPERFSLYITGKFRHEKGVDPSWFQKLVEDPQIKPRLELKLIDHISDVAAEIDRCDILVQTASHDVHDSKYATPQKSFGYMVRGKPILVGDVPCHHELFINGENGLMYRLAPQDLAEKAIYLTNHPDLGTRIAQGAWETSVDFSYDRRADEILSLVGNLESKTNK